MTRRKAYSLFSTCVLANFLREKARIPAWCDRILRKGNNLRQIAYDAAPLRFSDHRPVFAIFECTLSVVDVKRREALSHQLYADRRAVIDSSDALRSKDLLDENDSSEYDSIVPGLPPSSSERRKWWLDNGMAFDGPYSIELY